MATLQLYFLGPLDIRSGGQQLPRPPTLKSQSLLAYLIFHRNQPQPRERLVGLLWGECPERKARHSLSTALWRIRRCLPDDSALLSDPHTVQFNPLSNLWLDVEQFEAHVSRSDTASLQSAVALYRGDFLDGFHDDWIISERYHLEALYLDALARLMIIYEAGRDYQAALGTALRLLGRDPLCEDAHQVAMRAYCQLGQRKAALEQYKYCRQTVREELGTEPMVETSDLYQAILEGRFEVESLPEISPIEPRSVGPVGRSPLDVIPSVRLVGREWETVFLEDCWRKAQKDCSCLVFISGEVGVGKTRLVEAFANRLRWQDVRVLWGRCYEFERALPYQPIAEALRISLPALPYDALAGIPVWAFRETARLVPELQECPALREAPAEPDREITATQGPELPTAPGFDPEQARLFEGVTRVLAELSSQVGLLVVLEDLHWASESTLQLLHYLARHLTGRPVLIVGTFRPEAIGLQHPLHALHRQLAREGLAQQLDLLRLSYAAIETIIAEMSGAGEAVMPLAERLYRETEGNPFFLMEIVKALFETGVIQLKEGIWQGDFAQISEVELPLSTSLSEAIQARAQRLEENAQDALRLAAVLGREFSFELLNAAWGKGEQATLEALDDLLRHRLIEESVDRSDSDFVFSHHKIQEVIYQGLPRHRRLHMHAQVGAAMETAFATEFETRASELAHHFEQACLLDKSLSGKAIHYLLQAGQQAVRQFANPEAVRYYNRGLDILHSLPETVERNQQEIELQIALAVPTTVVEGYASPKTKRVYGRARDLCRKLGQTPALFTALVGLARYYAVGGDLETARELGQQLLAIAQKSQDSMLLLEACRQMGGVLFALGRLKEARTFWERGIALYDPSQHESHAYRFGHDPAVTCLGFLNMTLWLLGYPEQALMHSQNLYSLIPSMTHPSSQAYAHCHLSIQACLRHDVLTTHDRAETAIQLGQLHGLSSWTILATTLKGWALFEQEQVAEGLALMKEGIDAWRARGFAHFTPFFLAMHAEACLKLQKLKEGVVNVMAALAIEQAGGDRYWSAELYRLHGELIRSQSTDGRKAEAEFCHALETARQQGARMLELRAAMSLARLWRDQGQSQAAQQVLAEVYGRFDEGFDSYDLQEAKSLLRDLT